MFQPSCPSGLVNVLERNPETLKHQKMRRKLVVKLLVRFYLTE